MRQEFDVVQKLCAGEVLLAASRSSKPVASDRSRPSAFSLVFVGSPSSSGKDTALSLRERRFDSGWRHFHGYIVRHIQGYIV